jgi:hypothetical protein
VVVALLMVPIRVTGDGATPLAETVLEWIVLLLCLFWNRVFFLVREATNDVCKHMYFNKIGTEGIHLY